MVHLLLAIIYLSFISLGLPDALLGAAWPNMYLDLNTSISYAGIIFMIISVGTVISSLLSDRLLRTLGTGKMTAISVAATAIAIFGISIRLFPVYLIMILMLMVAMYKRMLSKQNKL